MKSFTPRSARISATVQTVIHTVVTKAIVETGPTLSWWFLSGTQASPIGAQVSTTRSAMSNMVLPEEWRGLFAFVSAGGAGGGEFLSSPLALGRGGGAVGDDFHAEPLGFEGDVDVDVVYARVGEQPHDVPLVEVVALHDLNTVALDALQEHELVNAAFADDAGKEGQRQSAHGVNPDDPADARIHVLDGNSGVATSERVDPALGLDGVGHRLGGLADVGDLGLLDE